MNYGEVCVLLLAVMPAIIACTDYCHANLCAKGKKHIACGNNGTFASICNKAQVINITPDMRRQIIRRHNSLRNKIAKGFKNFPPAKRMATMSWDNELAMLAELNVKQCEMLYDECNNTPGFSFVGQNIASATWISMKLYVFQVIQDLIRAWFNEYKNCPLHVIKSFKISNGASYRHFTSMVQDKNNRIGCAILRAVDLNFTQLIMTCNYAYDNILGTPVYSAGQTASQCTTGVDRIYGSLCSVEEKYN